VSVLITRWDGLLPTADAAALVGVKPGTIRVWVHRGYLEARGLDERGHPLYREEDVVAAEKRVRDNGLRTSGIDPRRTRRAA